MWILYFFKEIKAHEIHLLTVRPYESPSTVIVVFVTVVVCLSFSPLHYGRQFRLVCVLLSEGHVQSPSVRPCPVCAISCSFYLSPLCSFIHPFSSLLPAQLRVASLFSVTDDMFAFVSCSAYIRALGCGVCVGFSFSAVYQSVSCVPNRRKG